MPIKKNNKDYGTRVVIEEIQPNPYPDYLTVHYVVPEASNSFKILNTTSNISGWRIKGATTWETPTTTISVNNNVTLVLEYNLTDSTKLVGNQFNMCFNVCKIEFPASLTTINNGALFNCRCLCEMPNLQNITYIGSTNFYSVPSNNSTYIIEDNIVRDWVPWGNDWKCSNYMLVNGRLLSLYRGAFENAVDVNNKNLDFSNGIDGHIITEWAAYSERKTIPSLKFPTTLNKIWGAMFRNCTFTDVYFYNVTPPTQIVNGDNPTFFVNCTFNGNIYVPADSVNAYQEAFANVAQYITAMP